MRTRDGSRRGSWKKETTNMLCCYQEGPEHGLQVRKNYHDIEGQWARTNKIGETDRRWGLGRMLLRLLRSEWGGAPTEDSREIIKLPEEGSGSGSQLDEKLRRGVQRGLKRGGKKEGIVTFVLAVD